ncbi:alpha-hydroxy acid oxidase [Rhodobacter sp. 24-YEA-8]|uniref:alpha-hydroxy acid oxidase n=1 Tax=Rhodobacter sp. 24-YEA-8 TaxID=1884310 RepID=UPI000896F563|nr:alpha-hydroxy acid oxidase [Rhodobacter sp. 24-YEA-8]SED74086.1 L-lactate dehydrogenase (cytochrome) [Rhodobacter sp. 24-YEA-8]
MTFLDFEEARAMARRRLPRGIFEYIDRGTEAETALARGRAALDDVTLVQRVLTGTPPDPTVSLFGRQLPLPLIMAPTAFAGLVRHRGDIGLAKAARAAGIPFSVATEAVVAVEDVAREAGGDLWFQLYMWEGRENWQRLLDRARDCGIDTLFFTVDTPVFPKKVFNIRNGFGLPMKFGWRNMADVATHPRWTADVLGRSLLQGGLPRFAHYPPAARRSVLGRGGVSLSHKPGLSWDDAKAVRDYWPGKLVLKGIMHPDDALCAQKTGADGIVVSSHGARNFDSTVAPITMLPAIRKAVGPDFPLLADSGVRTGADVLKLMLAGADVVLLGRAMLYALAADGERGAANMIAIIAEELAQAKAFSPVRLQ